MRTATSMFSLTIAILAFAALWATDPANAQKAVKAIPARAVTGAPEGAKCVGCHKAMNPGLADEWHDSAHGKKGVMLRLPQGQDR
jgi:hypothetical protein